MSSAQKSTNGYTLPFVMLLLRTEHAGSPEVPGGETSGLPIEERTASPVALTFLPPGQPALSRGGVPRRPVKLPSGGATDWAE